MNINSGTENKPHRETKIQRPPSEGTATTASWWPRTVGTKNTSLPAGKRKAEGGAILASDGREVYNLGAASKKALSCVLTRYACHGGRETPPQNISKPRQALIRESPSFRKEHEFKGCEHLQMILTTSPPEHLPMGSSYLAWPVPKILSICIWRKSSKKCKLRKLQCKSALLLIDNWLCGHWRGCLPDTVASSLLQSCTEWAWQDQHPPEQLRRQRSPVNHHSDPSRGDGASGRRGTFPPPPPHFFLHLVVIGSLLILRSLTTRKPGNRV